LPVSAFWLLGARKKQQAQFAEDFLIKTYDPAPRKQSIRRASAAAATTKMWDMQAFLLQKAQVSGYASYPNEEVRGLRQSCQPFQTQQTGY
jgi:hypothetical protein